MQGLARIRLFVEVEIVNGLLGLMLRCCGQGEE